MNAASEQELTQRLSSMGYALRSVASGATQTQTTQSVSAPRTASAAATVRRPVSPVSVAPIVSIRSLSRFYRQLAVLVRSGIPIVQSLHELHATTANRKLRRACETLIERTQGGGQLSSAMALFPKLFPVHTVGLIWAGELGGYLDVALDEAASELEQEAKDNLYASVGWVIANISIFSLILALPMWDVAGFFTKVTAESMKRSSGTELGSVDPATAARAVGSVYMVGFLHYSIPVFIAWIVCLQIWKRLKRLPSVRGALDAGLMLLPGWGSLHREKGRERFLKTLHQQYNAGVAPAQAWAAASMSVRNSIMSRKLKSLEESLRQMDGNLQRAVSQSGVFEEEDAGVIASGERAGSVPEMLQRLSEHHNSVVSSSKLKLKLANAHILLLALTLPAAYLMIKMVSAFYSVGAKFGELQ